MQHSSPSKKECTFRNDIYQLYPATSTHHSVPTATIYSSLVQQYAVPPKLSVWLGFKVKATKCMYPVRNCPQSARRRYLHTMYCSMQYIAGFSLLLQLETPCIVVAFIVRDARKKRSKSTPCSSPGLMILAYGITYIHYIKGP